jgi:type I restriction enzyme M protein
VVLDKENAHTRRGIFMIDASRGFVKAGNKNRLRSQNMHNIMDVFMHGTEEPRYSRMVSFAEVSQNEVTRLVLLAYHEVCG